MTERPKGQGLQGLAIAAVLAYHFDETTFPVGFLGIDIFFVISGYFLAATFAHEAQLTTKVLRKFFTDSLQRLIPLYVFLLALLCIFVPLVLLEKDALRFYQDVYPIPWSFFFATNMQMSLLSKEYFSELFDSSIFSHTWYPCIEIQFCLIFPIIVFVQRKLPINFPILHLLLLASLTFQLLSSPIMASYLLPARVWQFLAGAIAHELSTRPSESDAIWKVSPTISYVKLPVSADEKKRKNEESHEKMFKDALWSLLDDFLTLSLIVIVMCPWTLFPVQHLRFITVLLTGISLARSDESPQGVLLTNKVITYLGSISYVVYLVHWPVLFVWRSRSGSILLPILETICCLVFILAVSIVLNHTIGYFTRTHLRAATMLTGALYAFIAFALILNFPRRMTWDMNENYQPTPYNIRLEAIEWNERVSHVNHFNKRPFEDCLDDPEGTMLRGGFSGKREFECVWKRNTTGSLNILVLGNSLAHRSMTLLHSIVENNFPQVALMRLFAMTPCSPIDRVRGCGPASAVNLVQAMQPDITFVIDDHSDRLLGPLLNATEDKATDKFTAFLEKIASSSRVVILDEPYPLPSASIGVAETLFKRLLRDEPTEDLKGTLSSFNTNYANYFTRLNQIDIPNLLRHNTSGPMCGDEEGLCWWYNRDNLLSYFTDNKHLSDEGLELLRGTYQMILWNLIQQLL